MFSPNSAPTSPLIMLGSMSTIEEDCASPPPPEQVGRTYVPGALYERVDGLFSLPLRGSWTLLCNTLAGGAPAALNPPAVCALDSFAAPRRLNNPLDHQLADANLIAPVGTRFAAPQVRPEVLTAWLHITNACNLDCPYCYVRKTGARMSLETGIKAIDALIGTARRYGFTTLKLKYAGGEAALHYRQVQRLHAYAAQQAARHDLTLQAVVLSNGTVMPEPFADWLAEVGVRLMLSVDGVGADHDIQRPWKHERTGTFAALERNLTERLLPRGIRPDICITVTGRTARTARTAVEWAIDYDLPFTLNFYRENEQSAKYHDLRYEEEQLIAGLLDAYALIERELPDRPFLNGLLDRVQPQAHGHTCGVGKHYVVITHEGQVAQCQMDLQGAQPFEAGSDLIRLVAAGPIHNLSVDDKEGCRTCAWRYRCAGGCPIVTLRATGRVDVKSPNCRVYQVLLPAALRLEGLRILKVQGFLAV